MSLQKIISFYVLIFVPLSFLIALSKIGIISNNVFVFGLLAYGFAYHPYISAQRLLKLNLIKRSEFWRSFIPFWNFKYFDTLFFNR